MRRRQIWAARAAAAVSDFANGTYSALAPETPLDAVGVFTPAVAMVEIFGEQCTLVGTENLDEVVANIGPIPFAPTEALEAWRADPLAVPKRRGRPRKVK